MRNGEVNIFCCLKHFRLCDVSMGSSQSNKLENPPSVELPRDHNIRSSMRTKMPMPDQNELDRRFTKILASMDLPPDKAKLLKQYDNEKKWDIICDQEMVPAKDPPSHYLFKLRTYLDPKASRSSRKRKMVGDATSTQVLRDLEISLRTNHIEWVREFLNDENHGLDALIEYLSFRLAMMRYEQLVSESRNSSSERIAVTTNGTCMGVLNNVNHNGTLTRPSLDLLDSPSIRRQSRHAAKLNMGDTKDDIHVCIMCLRAIMNNKYGFNMVIQHTEAINSIALCLMHKSLRSKALVLELLAAICLVKGGHEIILSAFDNFKEVCQEKRRFQTLMDYFMNYEIFHIEFMVACMQFVNIVVHSVEDMNFRVHLQYEFSKLGLDEYLDKLRHSESEELQVQISAYLDNVFDVAALMEDSETKTAALERVAELEEERAQEHEKRMDTERQFFALKAELDVLKMEREEFLKNDKMLKQELNELNKKLNDQEFQSKRFPLNDKKLNGSRIPFVPKTATCTCSCTCDVNNASTQVSVPSPPSPPPLPTSNVLLGPPPPPPPPPPPAGKPGTPSLPGINQALSGAMTIKRRIQTKYKLPTLNWIPLKPNQVRGTIYNELDDEKLMSVIDFSTFEEMFKLTDFGLDLTSGNTDIDGLSTFPSKRMKKPADNVSLLEHTRLRNIAISRRRIVLPVDKIIIAINCLDLKQISLENVETLQRIIPTEQESKAYREYINDKRDVNVLTEEDKFLLQLSRVERIQVKLAIMSYMGNFLEHVHTITPQLHAIINASNAVKNSKKMLRMLNVILAFGNYMNSSKRGGVYGFKIQSLDSLMDPKSNDKRICLLHYIAHTVRTKFPDILDFETELTYIEKSATVSLENLISDVQELEKNMELVRKEYEMRNKERPQAHAQNIIILKDFLSNSEDRLKRLRADTKLAQDSFRECVEYYGESPRSIDTNTFFSLFVRFTRNFKTADNENDRRRKMEIALQNKTLKTLNQKLNQKMQQEAVINELKNKTKQVQEKKLLHQDEVYNGALEDILHGLKSEPYRRADAVRRSQRRRIDSNRLSRTMEELEL